ncbi:MAG: hypothetical protein QOI74_1429 [Micromonosporaceae bacterium]|jgi:uncharacterized membrane protein|nr:hypothetical protein [Micromonosporaceae bacterium]MDT5035978.1 hypothetical protein [Micromonosporaceae bacterium]
MDRAAAGVLVIVGMLIAFILGRGYQVAHRAWADYKDAKARVPLLLRTFWAAVRAGLVVGMVGLLYLIGSVYLAASGAPKPTPSPVPAATRSPR